MKRRDFVQSSLVAAAALGVPGFKPVYALARAGKVADVAGVTGDGREITLRGADIQDLAAKLHGELLLAGDNGYEDARHILNPSFDKHPALIVQPVDVPDVQAAVNFARANSLLVAVKCGGHSHSGQSTCDRGMQIDLSRLRSVRIDAGARRVWATGGSLLGQIDKETAPHDLVTPLGTVSHTGVGGLTLGGGFGRVARKFGMAIDNVESRRHRHRGRQTGACERDRESRAVLGCARRQRQLRRGDAVRVQAASDESPGRRRLGGFPDRPGTRNPDDVERVRAGGSRRAVCRSDRDADARQRAGHGHAVSLLLRTAGGRRESARADPQAGHAAARHDQGDGVRAGAAVRRFDRHASDRLVPEGRLYRQDAGRPRHGDGRRVPRRSASHDSPVLPALRRGRVARAGQCDCVRASLRDRQHDDCGCLAGRRQGSIAAHRGSAHLLEDARAVHARLLRQRHGARSHREGHQRELPRQLLAAGRRSRASTIRPTCSG